MLFNSFEFIFAFLPVAFIVYYILNWKRLYLPARVWIIFCSLFYYCWWKIAYLPILLISIAVNYYIGNYLRVDAAPDRALSRKTMLVIGLVFNIALLGYFKYTDFFIGNINMLAGSSIKLLAITLPLGISFFTFQQIAYLVDVYRGQPAERDFFNYMLFISFFPKLSTGPIIHHAEVMPQFAEEKNYQINYENIARGIFIFAIGLFKKTVLADRLAVWAFQGYDIAPSLNFFEGWFACLAYIYQLYFDFSGYTDMAIGAALMINIKLPINFDSPYKSLSPTEFWARWHITLSRFLRDFIYIPLGGNRMGMIRQNMNTFITFLIGGLWHGAGWNFVIWGGMWGIALVIHRMWQRGGHKMRFVLAAILYNLFFNFQMVMFRAKSIKDALKVYRGMLGMNGVMLPEKWQIIPFLKSTGVGFGNWLGNLGDNNYILYFLIFSILLVALTKNSMELAEKFKPTLKWALFVGLLIGMSIIHLTQVSEFVYYNF